MAFKLSKDVNILLLGLILFVFSLIIISPILKQILSAIILTIIVYPIYSWINNKIKIKWLSSLIILVFLVLITFLLIFFIGKSLVGEAYRLFYSQDFELSNYMNFSSLERLPFYDQFIQSSESIKSLIFTKITDFVASIPSLLFNYIIILALTFFLLIDGVKGIEAISNLKLIKKKHYDFLLKEIWGITYGIVYGQIMVAIVQGLVGGLGIFIASKIFGVTNTSPIIWGSLMAVSALIPMVGTGLIWGPLSFFRIYQGILVNDTSLIFYGIFILLWGAIVVANIDGVIRPFFISSRIKVHPLIVLIGAIGGLMRFGFIGIFIGPIVLGLFTKSIDIFLKVSQRNVKG